MGPKKKINKKKRKEIEMKKKKINQSMTLVAIPDLT